MVDHKQSWTHLEFSQSSALGRMVLAPLSRYILPGGRISHPGMVTRLAMQEDQEAVASRLVATRLDRRT